MNDVPELSSAVWPEIGGSAVTLVVPLGSVEQHGPHLPLDTDTRIAGEVARRAVSALAAKSADAEGGRAADVRLAPSMPYGASGEHEGFPGTVSIGTEALTSVLLELGRSACRWAVRLLFVNGHGGNGAAVLAAVGTLRAEGRDAAWFPCAFPDADPHAGFTETSVLLEISPNDVHMHAAEPGDVRPITDIIGELRSVGVAGVSPNGVLGDPTGATGAHGARLLDVAAARLATAVDRWDVDSSGRLR
ncbi:mycofactocin biosynthesis peptidyl-dipeptidase MftE [Gordonia iterans]|uniref:Mycofactocin biosynthesis peptidyl-dipeptidase MftE n=1 Tax=Gordonia iterans TaxID=1004901 RepID=A0A2S0KIP9_9ACTN|nr:mycofactocin biosynthesis peptidyl-dipeptidase MftE [Gordonia iterans]AVM01557.1 mycofactocin biosynthesis peptidyl-dipeptidase MftE [Gordonia iterans]